MRQRLMMTAAAEDPEGCRDALKVLCRRMRAAFPQPVRLPGGELDHGSRLRLAHGRGRRLRTRVTDQIGRRVQAEAGRQSRVGLRIAVAAPIALVRHTVPLPAAAQDRNLVLAAVQVPLAPVPLSLPQPQYLAVSDRTVKAQRLQERGACSSGHARGTGGGEWAPGGVGGESFASGRDHCGIQPHNQAISSSITRAGN